MTTTEPCELHELTGCSICSGLDKKMAAEEHEEMPAQSAPWFARYSGVCARCSLPFPQSASVVWVSKNGEYLPAHLEC